MHTLIVNADLLFGEAGKIDYALAIGVDVQKVNARTKVLHQRAESPGVNGPMMSGLILIKFCVHWSLGLER